MKLILALMVILSSNVFAQLTNEELERRVNILADEVTQLKASQYKAGTDQRAFGLGQAASKVYFINQGLSIGGYGEITYTAQDTEDEDGNATDRDPKTEALRNIIYLGYKFNSKWLINTEIEIEHGNEIYTEFMYVDYLHSDLLNARFGLSLVPMGLVNELHEPIYFNSTKRPDVETYLIPSTWRENGIGIFGTLDKWNYKLFYYNGPDAYDIANGVSKGIRSGRKKGLDTESASTGVTTLKLDYNLDTANFIGASVLLGQASGYDSDFKLQYEDVDMTIYEVHANLRKNNWQLKALFTQTLFGNADDWNSQTAKTNSNGDTSKLGLLPDAMTGYYAELSYDINHDSAIFTPFIRYENYDLNDDVDSSYGSHNQSLEKELTVVGLSYRPIDRIIFKADYSFEKTAAEDGVNELNLGVGFVY